jgi:hypothetical protein
MMARIMNVQIVIPKTSPTTTAAEELVDFSDCVVLVMAVDVEVVTTLDNEADTVAMVVVSILTQRCGFALLKSGKHSHFSLLFKTL